MTACFLTHSSQALPYLYCNKLAPLEACSKLHCYLLALQVFLVRHDLFLSSECYPGQRVPGLFSAWTGDLLPSLITGLGQDLVLEVAGWKAPFPYKGSLTATVLAMWPSPSSNLATETGECLPCWTLLLLPRLLLKKSPTLHVFNRSPSLVRPTGDHMHKLKAKSSICLISFWGLAAHEFWGHPSYWLYLSPEVFLTFRSIIN